MQTMDLTIPFVEKSALELHDWTMQPWLALKPVKMTAVCMTQTEGSRWTAMTFQIHTKKVADRSPVLCRPVPGEMLQGDTSMSGLCEVDRDVSAN